ncbi:AmmeMemoRadiSam system protein B [Candidatus Symbiobacter mobilis]|uniref:MEMO1 family protein Cenrod_2651 n=1 Tax=Candidatus Symbiobacter mobilis CR TaxID=946483 RepID=U5NAU9_9BURK|nr:AmmeMemoRadiSam system protein B [Candidatus Symbiobacter mobilis]AGX88701.1 dioxygenase-like protein [Candidatus Symbiobacter mobilis CR]
MEPHSTPSPLRIRPAAVAGLFYPADPAVLFREVLALLGDTAGAAAPPKAMIVPHAGYVYSGQTAALGYRKLCAARGTITRVVLLGPAHTVPLQGLALPGVDAFDTPLGRVPIAPEATAQLAHLPQVLVSEAAHAQEHALEVQLPFLQTVLDQFSLVPLVVGAASTQEVAQVLLALWGGPETLLLVSSDLSHYLHHDAASALDAQTIASILALRPDVRREQACGAIPINGMLLAAQRKGLRPALLGRCNSGDVTLDRSRVVGYCAVAFDAPAESAHSTPQQQEDVAHVGVTPDGLVPDGPLLLALARHAIAEALGHPAPAPGPLPTWLQAPGASFVTLTQGGPLHELRGCIGSLEAHRSLLDDVRSNAVHAALHDPRFPPLHAEELARTRLEVSVLSPMQPLHAPDRNALLAQLRVGVDGVVLSYGHHRGTFLPQVWEQLPNHSDFVAHLLRKAGLAADFWHPELRCLRYTVQKWIE